jgi:periplasmic protein TonB
MSSAETLPTPMLSSTSTPGLFERVEGIGARSARSAWLLSCIFAFAVHAGGGGIAANRFNDIDDFMGMVRREVNQRLAASIDIDQLEQAEPEPEPEVEEPEPEVEEPTPEPLDPLPVDETQPPSDEPPPPAAAEAGQILAAEPDPTEPLDLTSDGFVTGPGTNFAGGKTASTGTSKTAVRDSRARAGGISGSNGKVDTAGGPPAVDKSRPAGLPVGANWNNCPWPAQAATEQINTAVVRVVVVVGADGSPTSVNVVSDPGFGFGGMAQRCAMRFKYPVGLDKMGNPTARPTPPFRIKFQR